MYLVLRSLSPLILFLLLTLLLAPHPASAQVTFPATGTPPFGSFSGGPDIINNANLNVHYLIPVLQKGGRGLPFNFFLTYDSLIWTPSGASGSQTWQPAKNFGWNGSELRIGNLVAALDNSTTICSPRPNEKFISTETAFWHYVDGWGTSHQFPGQSSVTTNQCTGTTTSKSLTNDMAIDGSGYTLSTNGNTATQLLGPDGNRINAPSNLNIGSGSVEDRNGNEISINSSGVLTDTLGTTALTVTGNFSSPPITMTYVAPSGANASYTMKFTAFTVKTNFGCSGVTDFPATSENLVSEIDLPDISTNPSDKYTFTYEPTPGFSGDVTGRLKSVTLPTGGTITYTYTGGNNGILCADGSTATLARTTPDGTWTYAQVKGSGAASTTTITAPKLPYDSAANETVIQFQGIYETQRQVHQGSTSGTLLRTVNTCYNGAASPCTATAITLPISSRTVLDQIGTSSGPICKHVYTYNSFGLPTEQDDFDYGPSAPGALLRKELIAYASLSNNIVNQPSSITVEDGSSNIKAKTTFCYDEGTPSGTTTCAAAGAPTATSGTPQHVAVSGSRGNVTTIAQLVSGSTTVGQRLTYFDTGTVNTSIDVNGAVTTFKYPDATSTCGNAFPTGINEPLSMTRSMAWNCTGGVQSSVTDENGKVTSTTWSDPDFWRPAATNFPDGGQTSIAYNSATSVTSTTKMNSSQNIVGTVLLDGLGRTKQTQLADPQPQGTDFVDTTYDALGRVTSVSNPHRSTSSSTDGTTTNAYDALSRPTSVTLQDGSVAHISYSNNTATATDPAGKKRQSTYDSLGRLTQVVEDPGGLGYISTYTYDALGNLTGVVQNGSRNRTFAYDGLSRLTSETNPETGMITYKYDSDTNCASPNSFNGDLLSRTDARGIRTCLQYDVLHRLTAKNYSDSTPAVSLSYDQASARGITLTNTIGRISSASTAGTNPTGSVFSYDPLGRVVNNSQCTPANCSTTPFPVQYTYDLAGDMTSYTNGVVLSGSNVTFTQAFDAAARVTQLTSNFTPDANHPAILASVDSTIGFYPDSAIRKMTHGNGLTATWAFNNRLQPCRYNTNSSGTALGTCADAIPSGSVQDFNLGFNAGSSDNGNVASFTATGTQIFNRSYTYDALNRLQALSAPGDACSGLSWTYDAWGNRTAQSATGGTCNTFSAAVNTNNQLSGSPYVYDAAGNLTNDGSHTYFYDAENRLIQVDGSSGFCATGSGTAATMCYLYDVQGRRVRKYIGSTVKDYVFNLASSVVAEITPTMGWQVGYNYLNGQLQSEYRNNTTYFIHADHLGSTRLLTDPAKVIQQNLDYLPFGENISTDSGISTHEFTGNQRDGESSLDHTLFRKYSFLSGRWTSPDRLRGNIGNPQSVNRYTYVLNNPINLADPLGLCPPRVPCREGGHPPTGNCDSFDISACGGAATGSCDSFEASGCAGGGSCSLEGIAVNCGVISSLANAGALQGVSAPAISGASPGGTFTFWLSGGSITSNDSRTGTSSTSYFDGEWVTIDQFASYVNQYNQSLGALSYDQRLGKIAQGVVKGAGVVGDPKYIVGFYLVSATGGTVIAPEAPAVIIQAGNTAAATYYTNEVVNQIVNFALGVYAAPGSQLPNTAATWFGRAVGWVLRQPEDW
jgi:RHS repeat-associated protein